MGKFPVHPIICKVLLYFAVLLIVVRRTMPERGQYSGQKIYNKIHVDEGISGWLSFTVPDPSGSSRVDMLTSPVAAARAAVATGAWVKSKHDVYLTRGSVGA